MGEVGVTSLLFPKSRSRPRARAPSPPGRDQQPRANPMAADRKKQVSLETDSDLEIDPGLILPKGIYPAIETQLPIPRNYRGVRCNGLRSNA
jgi:hypothetical protein